MVAVIVVVVLVDVAAVAVVVVVVVAGAVYVYVVGDVVATWYAQSSHTSRPFGLLPTSLGRPNSRSH